MKFYQNINGSIFEIVVLYNSPEGQEIKEGTMMEMKLTKMQVEILNEIAKDDFDKASAMLDGINLVLGTKYDWLCKQVVWFENPDGSTAERYAHVHDAWAWAE